MKISRLIIFVFLLTQSFLFAQNKEVLFTIDNHPYYTDEFVRVYNKNLDLVKDDSQKDLDKYLELFLGYKLKVEKANKLGLQNSVTYQNELKSYRNQLSKNYVNDSKVTNELVQEAYNRMTKEVRASHILILVDEGASPEDTLKAFNKIKDIKNRLNAGEDFVKVAQQFSEDPSVKENNGDLGYFSAFRMVYPFENAAFNTNVGEVSKPFRTRFGYHLVKVVDKRDNRGEVTVAHIMIVKPSTPDAQLEAKAKQTIDDIYQKIQQGEGFESLANQFSEDKSSASKGGVLQRFGSGQLSSEEFENVAFSLQNKNDISKPFQSQFGWHIVKLIDKHPVLSLTDMKNELEEKVRKDERSLLITNSLAKKLRAKYPQTKDSKVLASVKKIITDDFYSQTWETPLNLKDYNKTILTINKSKQVSAVAFLNFIHVQQKSKIKTKPISKLVDELFEKFIDEQVTTYYNENLENEFPEFKYVMDEYRDGLLLFDLMDREIWTKAKTDTLGLSNYFKQNIQNYQWKKRFDANIFSSTDKDVIAKAKKFLEKGKSIDYIKEKLNKDGKINIMVKSGLFEEDYDILPQYTNLSKGVSNVVTKDQYHFVVEVKEVKQAEAKKLTDCTGKAVNDYQQYLESNWVNELRKEFDVKVNAAVFETIKKQLQQ
ncbi:peptidyl-prolyl cis-trans isomerase [Flavobacterium sp. HXWNR29]|jgi:peptidyl-prolyl cis-trans isomerase SurA|uniref:peptidylprolyl isomerase n=1 Tax=Flavobacterium odoriferum TaxID=2946604 RepID=UPI0021CAEBFF|nr:peptidyl-prolyl cis-trans isomerase [Flavobacterium sp. HXWNR29]MCU4188683.1 peptidyl-prolyl cis-trans isomerase [Flavobacterium sp. HXWNR29]